MGQCLSRSSDLKAAPQAVAERALHPLDGPSASAYQAAPLEVPPQPPTASAATAVPEALIAVTEIAATEEESNTMNRIASVSEAATSGATGRSKKGLIHQASDITDEKKKAYERFHEQQHRGARQMSPTLNVLGDLHLDQVLGSGGFAAVFRGPSPPISGWWRGSTEVAVKVFATSPSNEDGRGGWTAAGPLTGGRGKGSAGEQSTGVSMGVPAKALAEAMLARDLAHPNIVRTYEVRVCCLVPAFMLALRKGSQSLLGNTFQSNPPNWSILASEPERARGFSGGGEGVMELGGIIALSISDTRGHQMLAHPKPEAGAQTARSVPGDEEMSEQWEQLRAYKGITPLWREKSKESEEAREDDSEALTTMDGFGTADFQAKYKAMPWTEVLDVVKAAPGDYLTVIVMHMANFGTLWTAIQSGVFRRQPTASSTDKRKRLRALLRTAREIALGLEHLHDNSVVHGDLKPGNVLLNDSRLDTRGYTALLADFGLSHIVGKGGKLTKHASGTTSYMAPELFGEGHISHSTDIYAFGILLWEMVHGRSAYAGLSPDQIVSAVMRGERPPWEESVEAQLQNLKDIYERCVVPKHSLRPTATDIIAGMAKAESQARQESAQSSRAAADAEGSNSASDDEETF